MSEKHIFSLVAVFVVILIAVVLISILPHSDKITGAVVWTDSNCQNRIKLTFDNSASSSNLVNFPALIKLNPSRIDYTKTSAADIRFYDDSALLYKETERWNASGESFIWVNIPQIDNTNTDYIYAYYNCSDTNSDNAANVWTSNFKMVQHLEETSGTHYDSTSNNNNGAPNGAINQNAAGQIDGADDFDGVNDYISVADASSLDFGTSSFSYMFWFKSRNTTTQYLLDKKGGALGDKNAGYKMGISTTAATGFSVALADGTTNVRIDTGAHPARGGNVWTLFSVVIDRAQQKMSVYINRDLINSSSISAVGSVSNSYNLDLGRMANASTNWFNGTMDEVIISNTALSPSWINASYLSMADQFITYGSEEEPSVIILTVTSPVETTYYTTAVDLNGTTDKNANISYSLDGADNVSVADNTQIFSADLTGLSYSSHTITVYAVDSADSLTASSKTINFNVSEPDPWADPYCQHRTRLTFNNSASSSNLVNFPALIKLNPSRINYSQTSAADIRFYDDSALLYKETELWNASGESFIWVKVPQIDNTNTDYIYAYYGCDNTNNDNAANVWDSNFKMVQHLKETSGTHYDSTSNDNDGTQNGGVNQDAAGQIDGADDFDGIDDCVAILHDNSLNLGTGDFTISTWIKYNPNNIDADIMRKGNTGNSPANYKIEVVNNKISATLYEQSGPGGTVETASTYDDNNWHYAVFERISGTLYLYVDGVLKDTQTGATSDLTNTANMSIGSKDGCNDDHFDGSIDEVCVSNIARSSDWNYASYLSMTNQFVSFESEEEQELVCGNGIVSLGEECDDGNNQNGDGCDSDCSFEFNNCTDDPYMVSYWKFEETSGTTAHDSVDANHGTLNGPQWTAGKVGGALDFDGTSDYVDVMHDNSLNFGTDDFTVAVWVKYSSQTGDQDIIRKGNMYNAGVIGNYKLELQNNYIAGIVQGTGAGNDGKVKTNSTYDDDNWHHIIFQRNSGTLYLYVDGDLEDTDDDATKNLTNTANATIGARDDHAEDFFDGIIDEAAVYNRALSPAEVKNLYQKGLSNYGYCEVPEIEPICGNGLSEQGEECDLGANNGMPGYCCNASCNFESISTVCRASAGDCDAAEQCTGQSAACPADSVEPASTHCDSWTEFGCVWGTEHQTDVGINSRVKHCDGQLKTCSGTITDSWDTYQNCGTCTYCYDLSCQSDPTNSSCAICAYSSTSQLCEDDYECALTSGDGYYTANQESQTYQYNTQGYCDSAGSCDYADGTQCNGKENNWCRPQVADCSNYCTQGGDDDDMDGLADDCDADCCENCDYDSDGWADQCDTDNDNDGVNDTEDCHDTNASIGQCGGVGANNICSEDPSSETSDGECITCSSECQTYNYDGYGPFYCDGTNWQTGWGTAHVCRASAGDCDLAEYCDGAGSCPSDSFNTGFVCRASAGACDIEETCDGTGPNCPTTDAKSTALCRASAGDCDLAEYCDGSNDNCPADAKSVAVCRPSAGDCDSAEYCNGESTNCPEDLLLESGTDCGECKQCNGQSVLCDVNAYEGEPDVFEPGLCSRDCHLGTCPPRTTGGGGGGATCVPEWTCTEWSECGTDGYQDRTCIDYGECFMTYNKPAEKQICNYIPPTAAAPAGITSEGCTSIWQLASSGKCTSQGYREVVYRDTNGCAIDRVDRIACNYQAPLAGQAFAGYGWNQIAALIGLGLAAALLLFLMLFKRRKKQKKKGKKKK